MLPWTLDLLDGRDGLRAGPSATVPTGRTLRSSTEATAVGVELDDDLDGLAVGRLDRRGRLGDERRADLAGDLGRGHPDRDGLVGIDRDLDLGRGLDEVALEVDEVGLVGERRQDRGGRLVDVGLGLAGHDDVESAGAEPAGRQTVAS